jgi:CheY-like chemotaxis protein
VLIVDDNVDSARTLARLLNLRGEQAHLAHDGPQAIEAAEQLDPDMVVLDIGLPTMSGYDVCRAIRDKLRGRKPVMIALTGWGQDEDRRRSMDAGFDHHLVKPVNCVLLGDLLDKLRAPPTAQSAQLPSQSGDMAIPALEDAI